MCKICTSTLQNILTMGSIVEYTMFMFFSVIAFEINLQLLFQFLNMQFIVFCFVFT